MAEPSSHTFECSVGRNSAFGHGDEPLPATSAARAGDYRKNSAPVRQPEAILPGLSAEVMDECVADLAEAVVAILLDQESAETGDSDDEGSHLR